MDIDGLLTQHAITLRVGHHAVGPGADTADRVAAAVEAYHRDIRLAGLDDELNPLILDPAKVSAFLAWLTRASAPTLARLRGSAVLLNDANVGLHLASAREAANAETDVTFPPNDAAVPYVPLCMHTKISPSAARRLADAAHSAMLRFDAEVIELDAANPPANPQARADRLRAASLARQRRYAAACVWLRNAVLLAEAEPDVAAHALERAKARATVDAYLVPPWTGMPRPVAKPTG